MREDDYKKLCNSCDSIISKLPSTISIPFLHVRREHPEALKTYQSINNKDIFLFIEIILNIVKLILNLLKSLTKAKIKIKNNEKIDVLIVSHLVTKKQIEENKDLYFENIPKIIEEIGYKINTIQIDHINITNKNIIGHTSENKKILLPQLLNFKDEIIIALKALKIAKEIIKKRHIINFEKKLYLCTLINSISPKTIATLRIEYQFKKIIEVIKPRVTLLTWEGHAWERLVINQAKKNNYFKSITIAYQFSILSRLQYSALRTLGNNYDPDYIFTAGRIGFKRFINSEKKITKNIYVIGKNNLISLNNKNNNKLTNILVVPEGILEECQLLLSFCEECAILNPEMRFTLRLHPSNNFEKLKLSNKINSKIKNIYYSENLLINDIENCTHVLYRGSSVVINALSSGLRPIYLSLENELSIDPIYELKTWKLIVKNPNQFIQYIKNENNDSEKEKEKEIAIKYARTYFQQLSIKKIKTILENLLNK